MKGVGLKWRCKLLWYILSCFDSTTTMDWENKLAFCATNVGLFDCGCCSTISNHGFLIVLIIYGVTVLSSCEIDSSLTLILNRFVCRYLVGVRNPCIGCKDCTIVLIYFCLGTNFFGHD
jgi:hypothetical protein